MTTGGKNRASSPKIHQGFNGLKAVSYLVGRKVCWVGALVGQPRFLIEQKSLKNCAAGLNSLLTMTHLFPKADDGNLKYDGKVDVFLSMRGLRDGEVHEMRAHCCILC